MISIRRMRRCLQMTMNRISTDSTEMTVSGWKRARKEQLKKAKMDADAANSFGRQIKAEMTPRQAGIILRMIDFSVSLGMHLQAIIDLDNKIQMAGYAEEDTDDR